MPNGARAPQEVRPGNGPFEREPLLKALRRSADATEDRILEHWMDPRIAMTHHVFGKLDPAQAARLLLSQFPMPRLAFQSARPPKAASMSAGTAAPSTASACEAPVRERA